jgi:hypothetical protein
VLAYHSVMWQKLHPSGLPNHPVTAAASARNQGAAAARDRNDRRVRYVINKNVQYVGLQIRKLGLA